MPIVILIVILIIIAMISELLDIGFWAAFGIGILILAAIVGIILLVDKFSKSEQATNATAVTIAIVAAIAIIIGFFVAFVGCESGDGEDASYYMDYNDNGQMDDGEHVYDTYQDGGGGVDYDGDGWNEYNYSPD